MHCLGRTLAAIILLMVACPGLGGDKTNDKPSAPKRAAYSAKWSWSFDAGYTDDNRAYAGGSEIMHLTAHQGKLYAANGYWVDSHWEIPPDSEKQSAQVLRLDSLNGTWQVDLELKDSHDLGLRYMKGNILKSVTFTRDASGKLLLKPRSLLVTAAGANFDRGGAVSVWVRDDTKQTWDHTLVRHGSSVGGVRWVPRDMEVYRDKVTGREHLFLLLGNPGIVSGVYAPSLPGKIRWNKHVEFPFLTKGSFKTRPLGIAQANGSLFFAVGGSIYQRHDGSKPTYTEILNLGNDADTDVGGIRGLTAIDNPKGSGQSLLFLWAPNGRVKGQIKRLDPNSSGDYTAHDESNLVDLMSKALGVRVANTLGAHNMMYPVIHPTTGKTVHIIGFQGNIRGKDHLRWKGSNLYAGAMYAIRAADQTYTVHEVNNAYESGKPVLVAPRAFCLSPFGDEHLFVGGHDSNSHISDDLAWVFKAPLGVALGVRPGLDASRRRSVSSPDARLLKGPVYELRIYVANDGSYQHLVKRFRDHTDHIFKKHGLEPVGYWLPTDNLEDRKKFVYILKHPSRYAAWKNWKSFFADREWQAVLKKPEFQRLLSDRPTSIFMTANDYAAASRNAISKPSGVYELRTYVTNPGKLSGLNARFRDHTTRIFNWHGIKNVGYWTPFDRPDVGNTLIYLVHHASRKQADANWKAFSSDLQWQKVARESQVDGKFLRRPPESIYLKATEFSPMK